MMPPPRGMHQTVVRASFSGYLEPSSWVMVTLGVGALAIVLRLRKRWAGVTVRSSRLQRPR